MTIEDEKKILQVQNLGKRDYRATWEYQRQLQRLRLEGKIPDTLLWVEHDPIYTIGKSGDVENVIASEEYLTSRGIRVLPVDRGGDVTYHGPGQLVGYPIFHLKQHHPSITWYMRTLEEVFIQALAHWNIHCKRIEKLTGVWVGEKKIVAMGVRMKRWVTMHGFALNVSTNLEHFRGIIPCGIVGKGVTSLRQITGSIPDEDVVKKIVLDSFQKLFSFDEIKTSTGPAHLPTKMDLEDQ